MGCRYTLHADGSHQKVLFMCPKHPQFGRAPTVGRALHWWTYFDTWPLWVEICAFWAAPSLKADNQLGTIGSSTICLERSMVEHDQLGTIDGRARPAWNDGRARPRPAWNDRWSSTTGLNNGQALEMLIHKRSVRMTNYRFTLALSFSAVTVRNGTTCQRRFQGYCC